ncbi:MAG: hypothetical protein U9Q77_07030 [Candidatus Marinimicrobia bacterium]|nr:hypothetical protein [Candidatus Neomarinimicrobiota bacterium]
MKFTNQWVLKLFLIPFSVFLVQSCTEELSIANFEDAFKNYEQELRIEGMLDLTDFSRSVIRVDKTILITDTSLYNGIDDNGDWESYTDLNGNGRWDEDEPLNDDVGIKQHGPHGEYEGRGNGQPDPGEPHIDDYIEILPQIHDSTMTSVILRESGALVAEFKWSWQAGYFDESFGGRGPSSEVVKNTYIRYTYGGYIPTLQFSEVVLVPGTEYTMELTTADGRIITASTIPVDDPLNVQWPGTTQEVDTINVSTLNYASLTWNTPIETNFCGVIMDEVFTADSVRGFYSALAVATSLDTSNGLPLYPANFIGIPLGLYKMVLESYSYEYGNYVYSGLPLRDRGLSNWRDQDGNVVLGAFGAKSPIEFYLRFVAPPDPPNG